MTKKITKATFKSFIKKNKEMLFISVESRFDGMSDMVEQRKGGFKIATFDAGNNDSTLGINGAWLVGSSRDWFTAYENEDFVGINVYNCCGSFTIAILK